MLKRVTITMDDQIQLNLNKLRANMLRNSDKNVSFSAVLSVVVLEGLQAIKKKGGVPVDTN